MNVKIEQTDKKDYDVKVPMSDKDHQQICDIIAKISPYIRFAGVIGKNGNLLSNYRRRDLKPLLNPKNMNYQFASIAIKTNLEETFDDSLGSVEFVWEERKKVQIVAFAIKSKRVWITIDKKVIRSEVIRIIDACLPIVKRYS